MICMYIHIPHSNFTLLDISSRTLFGVSSCLGESYCLQHPFGLCRICWERPFFHWPTGLDNDYSAPHDSYVKGTKVADLSTGPGNVVANTYSTALVISERAAVVIAEKLGIKVVI